MVFKGSMPALVTPFRNGKVDEKAFVALVERQIAAGTHALVPCGTTGEASTLSHEEDRHVVELCVKTAAGRVPVIAGAGSNSTAEAIGLLQHAKSVGAHAALIVNPYYNRPTQDGVYAHYKTLNEAVQLPIFVYNVPGRTGSDMQPELIGRLAKLSNIIGIKDASGDVARVARHTALAGKDFIQISGEDGNAVGFNALGGPFDARTMPGFGLLSGAAAFVMGLGAFLLTRYVAPPAQAPGWGLLGRVLDGLGRPIDGRPLPRGLSPWEVDRGAPAPLTAAAPHQAGRRSTVRGEGRVYRC